MEDNNTQQTIEQVTPQQLYIPSPTHLDLNIDICRKIIQGIPGNELRATYRPSKMTPRTFFLQCNFTLLPQILNQPCIQQVSSVTTRQIRPIFLESYIRDLQQYYSRQHTFTCVYNKLNTYRSDFCYFTGKLKGLDSMTDYNWKAFKEIQSYKNVQMYGGKDRIDSDFEAGNICRTYLSIQKQQSKRTITQRQTIPQYHLLIQNDLNTYGYNIWFFFRVRNHKTGTRRFIVSNIIKQTNFYQQGQLLSIFSMKEYQKVGRKWYKGGNNVTFGKTNFGRNRHRMEFYYYLAFQYEFQHAEDQVYFAVSQPYTYSRLVHLIESTQRLLHPTIHFQCSKLAYSISNNIIPLLRFSLKNPTIFQTPRPIILITARQHPCQTSGSFIAEAIIRKLATVSTNVVQHLLKMFQIVIVPMVNVDGVIHGMARTNMAGLDLNRQWGPHCLKELTPQTVKMQQIITQINKSNPIKYLIDLHGHGKKLNTFCFCCKPQDFKQNHRLFAFALKKLQQRFSMQSCTYGIDRDKQSTLRSAMYSMGVNHCYTLETSQFGWKNNKQQIYHFNENDYHQIAQSLLKAIFLIEGQSEFTQQELSLDKNMLLQELSTLQEKLEKDDNNTNNFKDNQSDSDPQGDRLDVKDLLSKCTNKLMKKKIQESYYKNKDKRSKDKKGLCRKDTSKEWRPRETLTHQFQKQNRAHNIFRGNSTMTPSKTVMSHKKQVSRERSTKKLTLPFKINKLTNLDQLSPFINSKKHSRIRTQPTSRQKILFSCSVGRTPENRNPYKFAHAQTRRKQKLSIDSAHETSKKQIRNQLYLKFKDLKRERLSHSLTQTILVVGVGPGHLGNSRPLCKGNQASLHASSYSNAQKISFENEDEYVEEEEIQKESRTRQFKNTGNKQSQKIRTLRKFIVQQGKNFPFRPNKAHPSVYYHFPIL